MVRQEFEGQGLVFKPLTASRAGEILKEKLEAIGLDPSKFSNHSFGSGGATSAANLNVPDRLSKVHGRWKSDSTKDGYVASLCSFAHWNLIYSIFVRVSLDSACIFLSLILLYHVSCVL